MKNIRIIFILSLLLVSCGDKGGDWTAEMKKSFMDSCVDEAAISVGESTAYAYCDCCVVELQKKYDMESFVSETMRMELGTASNNFSEDMAEIVIECAGKFMNY